MQDTYTEQGQLNSYVARTVAAGVRPIELLLRPICDCYDARAISYQAIVRVNSLLAGVLEPDDYLYGTEDETVLTAFTLRALRKALTAERSLAGAHVPCRTLFVRCAASLLHTDGLYTALRLAAAECGRDGKGGGVSLEFDADVMDAEPETLRAAFATIRAAGFSVAVNGYGGDTFAIERLLTVCPDHLLTDARVAALTEDRERRDTFAPLIHLPKSLGAEVFVTDVSSDDALRECRMRECAGFIPSRRYRGALSPDAEMRTVSAVIAAGGAHD